MYSQSYTVATNAVVAIAPGAQSVFTYGSIALTIDFARYISVDYYADWVLDVLEAVAQSMVPSLFSAVLHGIDLICFVFVKLVERTTRGRYGSDGDHGRASEAREVGDE